ncbi:(deoxy)nucleoside triphosphate pyrophosphohydrolase [Myxococcota bacterium]|nr:(deoxy)nucleoside triphosphate pyrophosphohydrolase [Myxococcota bacterium]
MGRVLVVAGLIEGPQPGRFLVSRRPAGAHLAFAWEFPGGKVEPCESPVSALERELAEELGIEVEVGDVFAVGHHVYTDADKEVVLLVYRCRWVRGEPQCLEVAEWQWVDVDTLLALPMPPADVPVLARLRRERAAFP